ncbi:MAG: YfiR family protein [Acidobacteriia bacterium]|nr:YfiR family protein [Terriglobia bacterium]
MELWRKSRKAAALLLLPLVLFVSTPEVSAQANTPSEYQVKAAFLFSFAKFIDWPPASFASPQSPFAICILGADPFGKTIDDALEGKTIGDHPVVVQRAKDAAEVRHCQIVFIGSSEKPRLAETIAHLQGANVLIVGETERFANSGGTIELMLEQKHVRFAINPDAAETAGLRISSKLLALAKIVRSTPESGRN